MKFSRIELPQAEAYLREKTHSGKHFGSWTKQKKGQLGKRGTELKTIDPNPRTLIRLTKLHMKYNSHARYDTKALNYTWENADLLVFQAATNSNLA